MESTDVLEAQSEQRAAAKRATFELLQGKKRASREISVVLNEGDDPVPFRFEAISAKKYDKLVTDNPPNKDQLAQGAAFNLDAFGPGLLAAVVVEPALSVEQWTELWNSDNWSGGEIAQLYSEAMALCNTGLALGPTAAG